MSRSSSNPLDDTASTMKTMLHALRHVISAEDVDDGLTMFIGPSRAANMLEVGIVDSNAGPVIVHAMPARSKYLRSP